MDSELLRRIKADTRIGQAMAAKRKEKRKWLFAYAVIVFVFASLLCLLASFDAVTACVTMLLAVLAAVLPACVLHHVQKEPKIFLGKISRIEENRKIVPRKGTGAFGFLNSGTCEVYDLLVAITADDGTTQVIFCSPQYEKILKTGDTLLCHSVLPYPAHLSHITQGICMHCGTMQDSANTRCITCDAPLYTLHTMQK